MPKATFNSNCPDIPAEQFFKKLFWIFRMGNGTLDMIDTDVINVWYVQIMPHFILHLYRKRIN